MQRPLRRQVEQNDDGVSRPGPEGTLSLGAHPSAALGPLLEGVPRPGAMASIIPCVGGQRADFAFCFFFYLEEELLELFSMLLFGGARP